MIFHVDTSRGCCPRPGQVALRRGTYLSLDQPWVLLGWSLLRRSLPPRSVPLGAALACVTRSSVDGGEVGGVVGTTLGGGGEMIDLVGTRLAAHVTDVVVTLEDAEP